MYLTTVLKEATNMPNWKKVIVSGSNAILASLNTSGNQEISGSLYVSGTTKLAGLTTANQLNVVTVDTASGQLYYTASSAFGGGSSPVSTVGFITTGSSTSNQSITGSLTISGSASVIGLVTSSTTLTNVLMVSSSGQIFTTASSAIGGSSALATSLTSNITVGGVPSGTTYGAGTSLESILRAMLITYIPPSVGGFYLKDSGSDVFFGTAYVEVGTTFTFNTASFTATADNPNGRFAYSASFTASGADSGNFNYYFGNDVLGSTNNLGLGGSRTVTKASNGNITFTLNSKNPQTGVTISVQEYALYVYPYFYGMSATDYSTTGNLYADGSLTKLLEGQSSKSLPITGSAAYVYYAYPAAYGLLSSIKDGNGFELLPGGFNIYTRTQAGIGWSGVLYNIYRSTTQTAVSPVQTYVFTI